jgi:hypothetical protein
MRRVPWWIGLLLAAMLHLPAFAGETPPQPENRIVVYYFYTTYRCASCQKIEAYTREAVHNSFAEDLAEGRVVWAPVNVDEKPNKHFVKDYKLYTKSVVVVEEIGGKQERWKNLPRVWELLGDRPGFLLYIQEETESYLAELP